MGCWMQQPFCTNCPEWKSRASPSFWFLFGQIIRETPLRISRILKYLGVSCGKQGRNLRFPEDFPIAQVDVLHPSAWDELWPRLLWRETNRLGMGFYQWGLPSLPGNTTWSGLIMMVVTQLKTPWTKLKKAWEGVSNTVQICSDEKEARFFQEANNRERWNLPWVYWNMRRYIDLESPRLGWKENLQETEVIQLVGTVKTMVSCRFPPCTNPLRQVVGRATPVEERLGGGVHVGDWGGTDLQIRWQTWAGGLQLNLVSWNMCWVWCFHIDFQTY